MTELIFIKSLYIDYQLFNQIEKERVLILKNGIFLVGF